jgi:hypothetical protein
MIHMLKLSPIYYDAVQNGIKTCEFRKEDDKVFRVGDTIHLREFDTDYTGRSCKVVVSHILRHEDFLPMPIGWALLSVKVLRSDTSCGNRTMPEESTMMTYTSCKACTSRRDCWIRTEATCKNCTNYGVCIEDEGKPVINAVDCEAETDDIDDEVCSCPLLKKRKK